MTESMMPHLKVIAVIAGALAVAVSTPLVAQQAGWTCRSRRSPAGRTA
jgi:hypothetical protein